MTFTMATRDGPREVRYAKEFTWRGHVFVVHHPVALDGVTERSGYRVSHKESGMAVTWSHVSQKAAREAALARLDERPMKSHAAIRKALKAKRVAP